ncbi:hypothetical protein SAMN02910358_00749 [Lachnospiraceae bacterium XBB1006]|nr:hypothetical protein SAMN02910358_00749 [Lachnospiraceae bacterium XBB1006]
MKLEIARKRNVKVREVKRLVDIGYKEKKKGEYRAEIVFRCRKCNQFLVGYDLVNDDTKLIMENVVLAPCRCSRVIRFENFSEGMLRRQLKGNVVKI